jgi:hypothetical protein
MKRFFHSSGWTGGNLWRMSSFCRTVFAAETRTGDAPDAVQEHYRLIELVQRFLLCVPPVQKPRSRVVNVNVRLYIPNAGDSQETKRPTLLVSEFNSVLRPCSVL